MAVRPRSRRGTTACRALRLAYLGNENDLALRMPFLQFDVCRSDLIKRIRCCDRDGDLAGGDQIGHFSEHVGAGGGGESFRFGAGFFCGVERDDGVDPVRLDSYSIARWT